MKIHYKVIYHNGNISYPLVEIKEFCCNEMVREFSGEFARQIEYCSDEEKPGLYFMNHDIEDGDTPEYLLKYCPDCGKKIELIKDN